MNQIRTKVLLFVFAFIAFLIHISAQVKFDPTKLTTPIQINSCLNQNSITAIAEDKYGQLWIGSNNGVNIIFGTDCKSLENLSLDQKVQLDESVKDIEIIENHVIIILENEIRHLEYSNDEFKYLVTSTAIEVQFSSIVDSNSLLIISDNKLYSYDLNKRSLNLQNALSSIENIIGLTATEKSALCITTTGVYKILNNKTTKIINQKFSKTIKARKGFYLINDKKIYSISNEKTKLVLNIPNLNNKKFEITDIQIDSKNNIWISTLYNGIILYHKTSEFVHIDQKLNSSRDKRNINLILRLYIDYYDNIWIGSNGSGLFKYNESSPGFQSTLNNFEVPNTVSFRNDIWSISTLTNADNNYIAASVDGLGVALYDITLFEPPYSQEPRWIRYEDNTNFDKNLVTNVIQHDGNLIIGTKKGLFKIKNSEFTTQETNYSDKDAINSFEEVPINALFNINDRIYTCTSKGLYNIMNKTTLIDNIEFIGHSHTQDNHYLFTESDIYVLINNEIQLVEKFTGIEIKNIFEPKENILWISTNRHSIMVYNKLTKDLSPLMTLQKNNQNISYGILSDSKGNYWTSTNNGLIHFNYDGKHITYSNEKNPEVQTEFNTNSLIKFQHKEKSYFLFGGVNGLTWFKEDYANLFDKANFATTKYQIEITSEKDRKVSYSLFYNQNSTNQEFNKIYLQDIKINVKQNDWTKIQEDSICFNKEKSLLDSKETNKLKTNVFLYPFQKHILSIKQQREKDYVTTFSNSINSIYSTLAWLCIILLIYLLILCLCWFSNQKKFLKNIELLNKSPNIEQFIKNIKKFHSTFWTYEQFNLKPNKNTKLIHNLKERNTPFQNSHYSISSGQLTFNKKKKSLLHFLAFPLTVIFEEKKLYKLQSTTESVANELNIQAAKYHFIPRLIKKHLSTQDPKEFFRKSLADLMVNLDIKSGLLCLRSSNKETITTFSKSDININYYPKDFKPSTNYNYNSLINKCDESWKIEQLDNVDPKFVSIDSMTKTEIAIPIGTKDNKIGVMLLALDKKLDNYNLFNAMLTEFSKQVELYFSDKKIQYAHSFLLNQFDIYSESIDSFANNLYESCKAYFLTENITIWKKSDEQKNREKVRYDIIKIPNNIFSPYDILSQIFKKTKEDEGEDEGEEIKSLLKLKPKEPIEIIDVETIRHVKKVYDFCRAYEFKSYIAIKFHLGSEHELFINIFSTNIFKKNLPEKDNKFLMDLISRVKFIIGNQKITRSIESMLDISGKHYKKEQEKPITQQIAEIAKSVLNGSSVAIFPYNDKPIMAGDEMGQSSGEYTLTKDDEIAIFPNSIVQTGNKFITEFEEYKSMLLKYADQSGLAVSETTFWEENGYQSMAATRLMYQDKIKGVMLFNFKDKQNFGNKDQYLSLSKFATIALINLERVNKMEGNIEELERQKVKLMTQIVTISDQFLFGIVMHDIRNLGSTIRSAHRELLIKVSNEEPYKKLEKEIKRVTKKILVCENRIEELTIILENSSQNVSKSPINIIESTKNIVRLYRLIYDEIDFIFNPNEKPLYCMTDNPRYQLVLYNLIDNAVKAIANYPKKEIRINIEHNKGSYEIQVQDFGVGIPKESTDIFNFGTSDFSSSGMGLHYAKKIMSKMGGRLELTKNSNPTQFSIYLNSETS